MGGGHLTMRTSLHGPVDLTAIVIRVRAPC